MPDSQRIPEADSAVLPRVRHIPRSVAMLSEKWAKAFDAREARWAVDDPQEAYEAYVSVGPCRACGRPLLGEPAPGADAEILALIDADNAAFRNKHGACGLGVWRIQNRRVEHCHLCCPAPRLSASQRDKLSRLLARPSARSAKQAAWRVELTCGHVAASATGTVSYVPSTVRCSECEIPRGVIKAECVDGQSDESIGASELNGGSTIGYQPLSDEQWIWIQHIVETDPASRRRWPYTDVRTIVDAALYKNHDRIPWRELPAQFGPWQTASRRHRKLVASSQWDEITRTLEGRAPVNLDAVEATEF